MEYRVSENNPKYGFIKLNRVLSEEEFISYRNGVGNMVTITNFGGTEFSCSGFCECHNDIPRRVTSHLSRSLYLIISALSTSMAMKIAKTNFQNECLLQLSETCRTEDIVSSVQECHESTENEEKKEGREYICRGHCVRNKRVTSKGGLRAQKMFGKCEDLETNGRVVVYNEKGERPQQSHLAARDAFKRDYLTSFCRASSRYSYIYGSQYTMNGVAKRKDVKCHYMCVGTLVGRSNNIQCNLIRNGRN